MDPITEQLVELNSRDWLDIVGILVPVILSLVLIFQNFIIHKRSELLQKQIHNRDVVNQAHEDILRIYRTYYDFCDVILTSRFSESVRHADVNFATSYLSELFNLKRHILQNLDLARLLFSQQEPETFSIIEDRFNSEMILLDMYHEYIFSGRLNEVSENAWNTVLANSGNPLYKGMAKYDYQELGNNRQMYNNFVALCKTPELDAITKQIEEVIDKHSYSNYGAYFEKHLCLEKL